MTGELVGILCDYWTGQALRQATPEELELAERVGGRGVITVDGQACYAYFATSLVVPVPRRASTESPERHQQAERAERMLELSAA